MYLASMPRTEETDPMWGNGVAPVIAVLGIMTLVGSMFGMIIGSLIGLELSPSS